MIRASTVAILAIVLAGSVAALALVACGQSSAGELEVTYYYLPG